MKKRCTSFGHVAVKKSVWRFRGSWPKLNHVWYQFGHDGHDDQFEFHKLSFTSNEHYPTPWQGSCESVVQNPYPTCGQPAIVALEDHHKGNKSPLSSSPENTANQSAKKPHREQASGLHPNEPRRRDFSPFRGWKSEGF